jgi:hypothetical protein
MKRRKKENEAGELDSFLWHRLSRTMRLERIRNRTAQQNIPAGK